MTRDADADVLDRSPGRTSAALSVAGALAAVVALAPGPAFPLPFAVLGAILVGVGVVSASRRAVNYGTGSLLFAATVAGANGVRPELLVPGVLCTLFAWDAGRYAIGIGDQLGRAADTTRAELVHGVFTASVGVAAAGVGYAAFRTASSGQPVAALALVFAGAVASVATLR